MWHKDEIKKYLKVNLRESRYNHTLGVVATAMELAKLYDADIEKAEIAALAHDMAKNMRVDDLKAIIDQENIVLSFDEQNIMEIWHAIVGPILAKKVFEIHDEEILGAMRWHTTGKENMTKLEKIVYIADLIEPSRHFKGLEELREVAKKDLDNALLNALTHTTKYLLDNGMYIDINSIKARNYLLYNRDR